MNSLSSNGNELMDFDNLFKKREIWYDCLWDSLPKYANYKTSTDCPKAFNNGHSHVHSLQQAVKRPQNKIWYSNVTTISQIGKQCKTIDS